MNWKKYSPISSVQAMGIVALIIVSGVGMMTVMSLQADQNPDTVTANLVDGKYYLTLYHASDYGTPGGHGGDPFVYDFINFEGKSLNLILTPNVLAIDAIYLMRVSDLYYAWDGSVIAPTSSGLGFIENLDRDVIKIAEYDLPTNVVSLVIDIPENDIPKTSWWLVCFCEAMGYRGGPDNNPDGKVIIDIIVI